MFLIIPAELIYPHNRIAGPTLARLKKGVRLWRTGRFNGIVVTGGRYLPSDVQTLSAADLMACWLRDHIPEHSRIFVEPNSLDTFENVRFTEQLLQEQLGEIAPRYWTVVSHPSHLRRFAVTCKALGITMHCAPVRYSLSLKAHLGEFAAYLMHRLDPLGKGRLARRNREPRRLRTWRPAALLP